MKVEYNNAEIEIVTFSQEDIITQSGGHETPPIVDPTLSVPENSND